MTHMVKQNKIYEPKPFPKNFGYTILKEISISEGIDVLLSIPAKKSFYRKHVLAKLAKENTTCVCCGRVGIKFGLGQGQHAGTEHRGEDMHWDLYSDDNVAFNIDHIHPKSCGGRNNISNCQIMCVICNSFKSNKSDRIMVYKRLLDERYKVTPMTIAGLTYLVIGDNQALPDYLIEELKPHLIEDYNYFGKCVYFV